MTLATPFLRINKTFLSIVGQWPHQAPIPKMICYSIMLFFTGTQTYVQLGGMICAWYADDINLFLESIPTVMVDFTCFAKIFNFAYNHQKMRKLLLILEDDWRQFQSSAEVEILKKYAYYGRRLTLLYAGTMYGTMSPFMLIPLVPIAYNIVAPANASLPKQLMFQQSEYLFDTNKYFYPLFFHGYCGTLAFITVVVAIDTMFMVYVQHACATFSMVGYSLEQVAKAEDLNIDLYPSYEEDKGHIKMGECVRKHNHALQYAQLIEDANSVSYFFQLGINMICISFTGFQTVMKINDAPDVSIRFGAFTASQIFILFLLSWPSQELLNSTWYRTSIRTRKLFTIMTMRSYIPCRLTAGKFYTLNLMNFSSVIRTSMSYVTVLLSVK